MKVKSSRFGEFTIKQEEVITFQDGILGFEHLKKFCIFDPGDKTLIMWLQAIEDSHIAFPIIEPLVFKADYKVQLLPAELQSLTLESVNEASVFCILTIPQDITKMSANLKAPIVINNKINTARQIVLQDSKLSVKFEMYKELKLAILNYSSDDSKRTQLETDRTKFSSKEIDNNTKTNSSERSVEIKRNEKTL